MVTSKEMINFEMGNRGSKSNILFVKEQRVNGSSVLYKKAVRCILVAGKPVMKINK